MKLNRMMMAALTMLALGSRTLDASGGTPTGITVNGVSVGTSVSGKDWKFDTSSGRLELSGKGVTYVLAGKAEADVLRVKVKADCTVVLDNVTLTEGSEHNALWLDESKDDLKVTLRFKGKNYLTGGQKAAGIGVWGNQQLTLQGDSAEAELHATGGNGGAGIGGEDTGDEANSCCGTVIVNEGLVYATGGPGGAGIGGGGGMISHQPVVGLNGKKNKDPVSGGFGGYVLVNGGRVIAKGGEKTSTCGMSGAGIGGGGFMRSNLTAGEDGSAGCVYLFGGTVKATGGSGSAGIGGANKGAGGRVVIGENALVWGVGGADAPGIGNATEVLDRNAFTLIVRGGDVRAHGGVGAAGIGGGRGSNGGACTFSGGHVAAYPDGQTSFVTGRLPAGIGAGAETTSLSKVGETVISGGTIETTSIGRTSNASSSTCAASLDVTGGSVALVEKDRSTIVARGAWVYEMIPEQKFSAGSPVSVTGLGGLVDGWGSKYAYGVKDLYPDADGRLHLYLTPGSYCFQLDGKDVTARLEGGKWNFSRWNAEVTFDANGGTVNGGKTSVRTYDSGVAIGSLPVPEREGYTFLGWRLADSDKGTVDASYVVKEAVTLVARWMNGGKASAKETVDCLVKANGGKFKDGTTQRWVAFEVGEKFSTAKLEVPVSGTVGETFDFWWDAGSNRTLADGDVIAAATVLVAIYRQPSAEVTFYYCMSATLDSDKDFQAGGSSVYGRTQIPSVYVAPPPDWNGHQFVGYFSQPYGKGVEFKQNMKVDASISAFYAYWKLVSADWTMNRYACCTNLSDLGVYLYSYSVLKKVSAENLPKGLKLVEDKSAHTWYLEGVPTETRDIDQNFIVIRSQFTDKNRADDVQKVMLNILPDEHAEWQVKLGTVVSKAASDLFGETVDATWKMSGMAANIKYAMKDGTKWKDDDKGEHTEKALVFYGQPNKIGPMTIVGKNTVSSKVPGQKGTFAEAYSAEVLVQPASGAFDGMYTVTAGELMSILDVSAAFPAATDSKTTPTGLPSGMKFTNKAIPNDKDYGSIAAGSFYGKPTKTGLFAVTLKDRNKKEAYFLVRVADPEAPEVGAYFGTKATKLKKAISAGTAGAEQNKPIALMVGATTSIPLSTRQGATLKATGLPAGLKLAQDKATNLWKIEGVPSKAGTALAKITATLNKVSTELTYIFEVEANAFAGEWRGYMASHTDAANLYDQTLSELVVSVAAGGATKVTLVERGVSTAYSFKSFDWDELNDNASVTFKTTVGKSGAAEREVTLEIVNKGGWYGVCGTARRTNAAEGAEDLESSGFAEAYPVVKGEEANKAILSAASDGQTVLPRAWSFKEDVSGGERDYSAIALVAATPDAKKGTAKVAGTLCSLFGGKKLALSALPVVRTGTDPAGEATYAYAPFTAAFNGTTILFNRLALDGSDFEVAYDQSDEFIYGGEYIAADTAECASAGKPIENALPAGGVVVCDFHPNGSDCFEIVLSTKGKLEIFDAMNNKLAALSAKFGKDGLCTFSFSSADKLAKYTLTVFALGDGTLTGSVTMVRKDGKSTITYVGLADIY